MRSILLLSALLLLLLSSCTNVQFHGPSFDTPDAIPSNLDPYGYDERDVTHIGKLPIHAAGALNFTWTFDWPLGHKLPGEK